MRAKTAFPGRSGALISASGSGAPSGKTTATTVMPGTTSRMTSPALARIAGVKTALPAFPTIKQRLCFALALWNGRDPILKERLFGLTNSEGNHGEDVKEYYFYLDSTPTHSYMKYLYKYPQWNFPIAIWCETNRRRSKEEFEYELLDTGTFNEDRYFDVFVEYAKADPEDLLIKITVHNRGPEAAAIHLLPTLWFRNTWSVGGTEKPVLRGENGAIQASHPKLGDYTLHCQGAGELLFTENDSNAFRLWGQPNLFPYVKDAFHEYLIAGNKDAVNPAQNGYQGSRALLSDSCRRTQVHFVAPALKCSRRSL